MISITKKQARDVYYLFRAMHDGTCPNCGYSANSNEFENSKNNDLTCPNCLFTLYGDQIKIAKQVLEDRRKSFSEIDNKLFKIGSGEKYTINED